MDTDTKAAYGNLFALFNKNLYGPEPGEEINQEGLVETLEGLELNPEDAYVMSQFRRWWAYYGGSLEETLV